MQHKKKHKCALGSTHGLVDSLAIESAIGTSLGPSDCESVGNQLGPSEETLCAAIEQN